jgi:hypothetical protein
MRVTPSRGFLLIATILCLTSSALAQNTNTVWDIALENCSGKYRLTVTRQGDDSTLDIAFTDKSGKSVQIAHDRRQLWSFLYAWPTSVLPHGVVAVWECGTGNCMTVYSLKPKASKPVFDEWSESVPEFIWTDAGQVMLFYSGKRYLRGSSGLWQPREAAVYLWTGDRYQLTTKVPYEQRFPALAKMRRSTAQEATASPCDN